MTKPMTDFNWGKKFTELQEKQGKLGTQKALISRSFIAHAIDQATSKAREEALKLRKTEIELFEYLLQRHDKMRDELLKKLQSLKKDK